jgi:hypothetical protein
MLFSKLDESVRKGGACKGPDHCQGDSFSSLLFERLDGFAGVTHGRDNAMRMAVVKCVDKPYFVAGGEVMSASSVHSYTTRQVREGNLGKGTSEYAGYSRRFSRNLGFTSSLRINAGSWNLRTERAIRRLGAMLAEERPMQR